MPRRATKFRSQAFRVPGAPEHSLTAAAKSYISGESPGVEKLRRVGRRSNSNTWQNEVWELYDIVPEFHSACTWVGNLLSKAKLVVYKNGQPTTDQVALDALASLFDGPEGQEEMFRLLGVNFTAAGEAWIIGQPTKDGDEWSVVASTQVSGENTKDLTIEGSPAKPGTLGVRMWRTHPANSEESDPPARALLPVLTQLHRLTLVINAQADSRLKGNGILWVPQELELPNVPVASLDGDGEETVSMQTQSVSMGLTRRIIDTAKIAMSDPSSAAAGVPIVIAIPGEMLENPPVLMDFFTGFDENVKSLREESITRIGIGMDMPPEALTGTGDMNHWGSWAVEEAAIKIHTEPLLSIIVSSLTTGYLHKFLQAEGVDDWAAYSFEADTSALRLRPNRSKEAIELFNLGELSAKTLLIENGFDPENDAPDEQEKMYQFIRRMVEKTSATPEQLADLLKRLGLNGVPKGEQGELRGAMPSAPSLDEHPVRSAPDPEESEAQGVRASAAFVVDGLTLAAEQAVLRALERAGNRLKVRIGRDTGGPACERYLTAPRMPLAECEALLEDAWGLVERMSYPGVNMAQYREVLHQHALSLLRMQTPYDRGALARALMLGLADEAA